MAKTFKNAVNRESNNRMTVQDSVRRDKEAGIPRDIRRNRLASYKQHEFKLAPEDTTRMLDALTGAMMGKCRGVKEELKVYRKWVPALIVEFFDIVEVLQSTYESVEAVDNGMAKRNRKRWTSEEDEQLIEMAADGASMSLMGFVLDRTPTAVQTRISYLVGIEKLSVDVAGKFIGWLNGEIVEGEID